MLDAITVVAPVEISAPIDAHDKSLLVQEQPHKPIIRIPESEVKPLIKVPMSATEQHDQKAALKIVSLLVVTVMMMFMFMK